MLPGDHRHQRVMSSRADSVQRTALGAPAAAEVGHKRLFRQVRIGAPGISKRPPQFCSAAKVLLREPGGAIFRSLGTMSGAGRDALDTCRLL